MKKIKKDTVVKTLCSIWFMTGLLTMCSCGPDGEITLLTIAGLAVFAGFAFFADAADKRGWLGFKPEDDEA